VSTWVSCLFVGLKAFLRIAVAKCKALWSAEIEPPHRIPGADAARAIEALGGEASKPEPPKAHVEIGAEVGKITLEGLPQSAWPRSEVVDKLANDAAKMKRKGIQSPYVYADMMAFLPHWAETKKADEKPDPEESEVAQGFQVSTITQQWPSCVKTHRYSPVCFQALADVLKQSMMKGGGKSGKKKYMDLMRYIFVLHVLIVTLRLSSYMFLAGGASHLIDLPLPQLLWKTS